jgi:pimeloyl-ACP methyl ester carboxylesterase
VVRRSSTRDLPIGTIEMLTNVQNQLSQPDRCWVFGQAARVEQGLLIFSRVDRRRPGYGHDADCLNWSQGTGRQLWYALFIYVPTLVLASERDIWSHPVDRDKLIQDLAHASLRVIVIPNATHFVHMERPERGRQLLLNEVLEFLRRSRVAAAAC